MKSDRLIALLLALQNDGKRSAPELAAELEVSARTIYRDIDALCAAGVPVYAERGAQGGIVLADSYRDTLARFDEGELRALFVSSDDVLADVGLVGDRKSALKKLANALPARARRSIENGLSRVHVDARGWSRNAGPSAFLSMLRDAVWSDRCVTITYRDRGGATSRRTLEPYGLVAKAGIWYLVACDRETMKTFRVQRIEAVRVLDRAFTRPPGFDVAEYWATVASKVLPGTPFVATFRMDDRAMANANVYLQVESTRRIARTTPHEYLVRITFASFDHAVHESFGWSTGAIALEPPELRTRLVERAREVLVRYAPSGFEKESLRTTHEVVQ
jgi:predicted DNA-binding transcriptional regulator YafY